jgi:hypothetical protein
VRTALYFEMMLIAASALVLAVLLGRHFFGLLAERAFFGSTHPFD